MKEIVAAVDSVVNDCTALFEQLLKVVTSLQEDPNVQRLEMEVRELQQLYDKFKVMTRTISITQRLAQLQEAKALKEQVDVAQHKEAVLKACLKPWLDEAYLIIATIESKLDSLQATKQI